MPTHIVVNSLGLTYKGTIGMSIATIPDVCKTPSPGGPIPLPYPNIANQGTLKDGTTTVFAKGGKMIAIKGSQYGMSSGDEPGTVGGVKSNVFKKATDWITYSFDVKMDGQNACRHTDKKFHNDKNTVNLAGDLDPQAPAVGLAAIAEKCNESVNKKAGYCKKGGGGPSGAACKDLGTKKHKCCEKAIKKWSKANPDKKPTIESEVPYSSDGNTPPTYTRIKANADSAARKAADAVYKAAKAAGTLTKKTWQNAYFGGGGAAFKADVIVNSRPPKAYDFKFDCEPSAPPYKIGKKAGKPKPLSRFMSEKQRSKYIRAIGVRPRIIHVDGGSCGGAGGKATVGWSKTGAARA